MKLSDEMIVLNLLKTKHGGMDVGSLMDHVDESPDIKNVCARMPVPLIKELDSVCGLLGISKTSGIISAVQAFIDRVWELEQEHGVLDHLDAWEIYEKGESKDD